MLEIFNFYFPVAGVNINVIILIIIGFITGFLSGLLGIGGGFIIVPLLTILFGIPIKVAIGTSSAYITITSIVGSYKHIKNGFVNFKIVFAIGISAIISAQIGAMLCIKTPKDIVQILFGAILILIGVYMLIKERYKFSMKFQGEKFFVSIPIAFLIGIVVGLFSGFFGIGGAIILIPLMLYIMKLQPHLVIGCSLMISMLSAFSGTITYLANNFVDVYLLVALVSGSIFSAYIGASMSSKIKQKKLKEIFAILIIIIGFKMIGVI